MDYEKMIEKYFRYSQLGYPSPFIINYEGHQFPIYLPDQDDYISRIIVGSETFYEINILEHIRHRYPKHRKILDVGANIGNHARYFESFLDFEQIVCFEPDVANYQLLLKNITNPKTIAIHAAVGDRNGKVSVQRQVSNNCGSCQVIEGGDIDMITLDSTGISDVSLLKIDVERKELAVLKGGINLLLRCKPLIHIEIIEHETDCRAFLASLGFIQTALFYVDGMPNQEFMHLDKLYARS